MNNTKRVFAAAVLGATALLGPTAATAAAAELTNVSCGLPSDLCPVTNPLGQALAPVLDTVYVLLGSAGI
ncbi:hypothetical protein GCM10023084_26810 [Streptomyces lacrimifluminis]|uniref:Secreted protein n=1 Tax=Streptomyces lacrimifluminis TaxID=1500077 RepID=A0A917KSX2_9ACTN|nr:hypothetical protein GCM10012282_23420 [Streptomyces lacrimifluminis]